MFASNRVSADRCSLWLYVWLYQLATALVALTFSVSVHQCMSVKEFLGSIPCTYLGYPSIEVGRLGSSLALGYNL